MVEKSTKLSRIHEENKRIIKILESWKRRMKIRENMKSEIINIIYGNSKENIEDYLEKKKIKVIR